MGFEKRVGIADSNSDPRTPKGGGSVSSSGWTSSKLANRNLRLIGYSDSNG